MEQDKTENARPETAKERLLHVAGCVFAEKGFDRATGKEICIRAGVNPAAVNYYFGSKDGLYTAVLQEAHRGVLSRERLAAALAEGSPPEEKLRIFVKLVLERLFSTSTEGWWMQVLVREMAMPSAAFPELVENEIKPKSVFLRSIMAEILERPYDDPVASRCAVSVISQLLALFQNKAIFSAVFPTMEYNAAFFEAMAAHILEFSLGGVLRVKSATEDQARASHA